MHGSGGRGRALSSGCAKWLSTQQPPVWSPSCAMCVLSAATTSSISPAPEALRRDAGSAANAIAAPTASASTPTA